MSTQTGPELRLRELCEAVPFAVHWQFHPLRRTGAAAIPAGTASAGTIAATASTAATSATAGSPGLGKPAAMGERADVVVPSFSTRKVSILCATLALARAGRLDLEQRLMITEELKEGVQAGIMRNLSAGLELSLQDCLRQMMATSDNICTQLVFEAIGAAIGPDQPDALQYVNDYCAWAGLRATLHREVFPRTGALAWHHSLDGLTLTTAADQCHLLTQLARGMSNEDAAAALQLMPEDCRFAVGLMRGLYTPRLGAATTRIGFAEKNGRGLRSLSQVGIALEPAGTPLAAVAVFAETVPTRLPDGVPGRTAVFDLFAEIGLAIEAWAFPLEVA